MSPALAELTAACSVPTPGETVVVETEGDGGGGDGGDGGDAGGGEGDGGGGDGGGGDGDR